jgi:hypothetical protein
MACVYAMKNDRAMLLQTLNEVGTGTTIWRAVQAHSDDYFALFQSNPSTIDVICP